MNTINILGISIPSILLIYFAIKIINNIYSSKFDRKIAKETKDMTEKQKYIYFKNLKDNFKKENNKPTKKFETIIIIVAFTLVGVLVLGSIVGIIYLLLQ